MFHFQEILIFRKIRFRCKKGMDGSSNKTCCHNFLRIILCMHDGMIQWVCKEGSLKDAWKKGRRLHGLNIDM